MILWALFFRKVEDRGIWPSGPNHLTPSRCFQACCGIQLQYVSAHEHQCIKAGPPFFLSTKISIQIYFVSLWPNTRDFPLCAFAHLFRSTQMSTTMSCLFHLVCLESPSSLQMCSISLFAQDLPLRQYHRRFSIKRYVPHRYVFVCPPPGLK